MLNPKTRSEKYFSTELFGNKPLGNDHWATKQRTRNLPILHGIRISVLAEEHYSKIKTKS